MFIQNISCVEWENRAYLATFPRSGNGWVRRLIEDATGFITTSVYPEKKNESHPISHEWGGYCSKKETSFYHYPTTGQMAVVKTHYPEHKAQSYDLLPSKVAVRIIRHPLDTIYSYYCFENPNLGKVAIVPSSYVKEKVARWRKFNEYWNQQPNVVTLRFEDIYNDPIPNLATILTALSYSYNDKDLLRAVDLQPPKGGVYKHFQHFTIPDINYVYTQLDDLLTMYKYK